MRKSGRNGILYHHQIAKQFMIGYIEISRNYEFNPDYAIESYKIAFMLVLWVFAKNLYPAKGRKWNIC